MSDKTLSGVSHTASGMDKNYLTNLKLNFAKFRNNQYAIFKAGTKLPFYESYKI